MSLAIPYNDGLFLSDHAVLREAPLLNRMLPDIFPMPVDSGDECVFYFPKCDDVEMLSERFERLLDMELSGDYSRNAELLDSAAAELKILSGALGGMCNALDSAAPELLRRAARLHFSNPADFTVCAGGAVAFLHGLRRAGEDARLSFRELQRFFSDARETAAGALRRAEQERGRQERMAETISKIQPRFSMLRRVRIAFKPDSNAKLEFGLRHLHGIGVEEDLAKARELLMDFGDFLDSWTSDQIRPAPAADAGAARAKTIVPTPRPKNTAAHARLAAYRSGMRLLAAGELNQAHESLSQRGAELLVDSESSRRLGEHFAECRHLAKARLWYENSIKRGNFRSRWEFVRLLDSAVFGTSNKDLAKQLLLDGHPRSVNAGELKYDSWRIRELGLFYLREDKRDIARAERWLRKTPDEIDAQTQLALAAHCDAVRDAPSAFFWIEAAALQGDAAAMLNLALRCRGGIGTPVNNSEYARWMKSSADAGDSEAMEMWGDFLANKPDARASNPAEAARYFRKAAESGRDTAKTKIGQALLSGATTKTRIQEADIWLSQVADSISEGEQLRLGAAILRCGLKPERVAFWREKCASRGNAEAQFRYAACLSAGFGAARNQELAARWLCCSARQNFQPAIFALAANNVVLQTISKTAATLEKLKQCLSM